MADSVNQNPDMKVGPVSLTTTPFPVIGLGASAGGLQPLKDFFTHMPADSGMAFVVILHLSPKHESHAATLLQATTKMPVTSGASRQGRSESCLCDPTDKKSRDE